MAGLIQDQTKQQINGIPGAMQVPILGALFKSRDYVNRATELAVIVTPYVVRSVAQSSCPVRTTALPMRAIRNRAARPAQPDLRRCRQGRSQAHVQRQLRFILD